MSRSKVEVLGEHRQYKIIIGLIRLGRGPYCIPKLIRAWQLPACPFQDEGLLMCCTVLGFEANVGQPGLRAPRVADDVLFINRVFLGLQVGIACQ